MILVTDIISTTDSFIIIIVDIIPGIYIVFFFSIKAKGQKSKCFNRTKTMRGGKGIRHNPV